MNTLTIILIAIAAITTGTAIYFMIETMKNRKWEKEEAAYQREVRDYREEVAQYSNEKLRTEYINQYTSWTVEDHPQRVDSTIINELIRREGETVITELTNRSEAIINRKKTTATSTAPSLPTQKRTGMTDEEIIQQFPQLFGN